MKNCTKCQFAERCVRQIVVAAQHHVHAPFFLPECNAAGALNDWEPKGKTRDVLDYIQAHDGCCQRDICAYLGISHHTVNTALVRLRDRGFVEATGTKGHPYTYRAL